MFSLPLYFRTNNSPDGIHQKVWPKSGNEKKFFSGNLLTVSTLMLSYFPVRLKSKHVTAGRSVRIWNVYLQTLVSESSEFTRNKLDFVFCRYT